MNKAAVIFSIYTILALCVDIVSMFMFVPWRKFPFISPDALLVQANKAEENKGLFKFVQMLRWISYLYLMFAVITAIQQVSASKFGSSMSRNNKMMLLRPLLTTFITITNIVFFVPWAEFPWLNPKSVMSSYERAKENRTLYETVQVLRYVVLFIAIIA